MFTYNLHNIYIYTDIFTVFYIVLSHLRINLFHSTQYFWARSLRATSLWFKASYKIWYEAPSALDCFQCKSVLNPFSTKSSLSLSMAVISASVTFKRRPSFLQAAPTSVLVHHHQVFPVWLKQRKIGKNQEQRVNIIDS